MIWTMYWWVPQTSVAGQKGSVGLQLPDVRGFFCPRVKTAVQVAVRRDYLKRVTRVIAQHCPEGGKPDSAECIPEEDSSMTKQRFYDSTVNWAARLYLTKGHTAVHLQIAGLNIRLVGAHFDTKQFKENLQEFTGPAIGRWSRDEGGVSIIAADFNNRIDDVATREICSNLEDLSNVLKADSTGVNETLQLTTVTEALEAGAHQQGSYGLVVEIARPASDAGGVVLPTYKYTTAVSEQGHPQSAQALFSSWKEQCKKFNKEGRTADLGVLDSVAWAIDPAGAWVVNHQGAPTWAKLPGSDHALIGATLEIRAKG